MNESFNDIEKTIDEQFKQFRKKLLQDYQENNIPKFFNEENIRFVVKLFALDLDKKLKGLKSTLKNKIKEKYHESI